MKSNFFLFGLLFLFVIGIASFSGLWKGEIAQNKKVSEQENNAGDSKLESPANKIEQVNNSVLPEVLENSSMQNLPDENSEAQERELRRMEGIERRKAIMEERKQYKTARRKWRTSLNQARAEAKISGDYSLYEELKKQEPYKN